MFLTYTLHHNFAIHLFGDLGIQILNLTQTQLTQKINAKQKSISRYETGASLPSIKTLVKIAKVLKKPAGYFLEE